MLRIVSMSAFLSFRIITRRPLLILWAQCQAGICGTDRARLAGPQRAPLPQWIPHLLIKASKQEFWGTAFRDCVSRILKLPWSLAQSRGDRWDPMGAKKPWDWSMLGTAAGWSPRAASTLGRSPRAAVSQITWSLLRRWRPLR